MSQNELRTLTKLALITLSILLSGCAAALNCGDARVARFEAAYFPWDMTRVHGYTVSLPVVSLAHTGTTRFHIKGLPAAHYDYTLRMNGGYHRGRYNITDPQTRVAIRFTAPDGTVLLQTDRKRVELELVPGSGVHTAGSLLPTDAMSSLDAASKLSKATDYEVSITVIQPAQVLDETMLIEGFAPTR